MKKYVTLSVLLVLCVAYGQTIERTVSQPMKSADAPIKKLVNTTPGWKVQTGDRPWCLRSVAFQPNKFEEQIDPDKLELQFEGSDGSLWKATRWEKIVK